MKKALFIMLLIPSLSFAEFGIMAEYGQTIEEAQSVECLLKYRFKFGNFQNIIYGGWNTWFYFDYKDFAGHPSYDIYTAGNTFKYKSFYVDIKHFCSHEFPSKYPKYNYMTLGGTTKFSIGFEHWF